MPYDVTVLPGQRVALITCVGALSGGDFARARVEMQTAALWEVGFDEVWDYTAISEMDVTPDDLDRLVQIAHDHAHLVGPNRVAFVSMRDTVAALVRLYERRTADLGRSYRVVRTRDEAGDWLGVSLPPDGFARERDG